MNEQTGQEMTLDEYVGVLHRSHRAVNELATLRTKLAASETSLAEAKQSLYEARKQFDFDWNVQRKKLAAALAREAALREALETLRSDAQCTVDQYNKNGPTWTSKDGNEYYSASYVVDGANERIAKIDEAQAAQEAKPE